MILFQKYLFLEDFQIIRPTYFGFFQIFSLVILLNLIIGLISIIHLLTHDFKDNTLRTFWLVGIVFTSGFAGWFYWFQRKKFLLDKESSSD